MNSHAHGMQTGCIKDVLLIFRLFHFFPSQLSGTSPALEKAWIQLSLINSVYHHKVHRQWRTSHIQGHVCTEGFFSVELYDPRVKYQNLQLCCNALIAIAKNINLFYAKLWTFGHCFASNEIFTCPFRCIQFIRMRMSAACWTVMADNGHIAFVII